MRVLPPGVAGEGGLAPGAWSLELRALARLVPQAADMMLLSMGNLTRAKALRRAYTTSRVSLIGGAFPGSGAKFQRSTQRWCHWSLCSGRGKLPVRDLLHLGLHVSGIGRAWSRCNTLRGAQCCFGAVAGGRNLLRGRRGPVFEQDLLAVHLSAQDRNRVAACVHPGSGKPKYAEAIERQSEDRALQSRVEIFESA